MWQRDKYLGRTLKRSMDPNQPVGRPKIACLMSHVRVWEQLANDPDPDKYVDTHCFLTRAKTPRRPALATAAVHDLVLARAVWGRQLAMFSWAVWIGHGTATAHLQRAMIVPCARVATTDSDVLLVCIRL